MNTHRRIPLLAAALSLLLPGLGQLYAGKLARALAIVTIGFALIFLLGFVQQTGDMLQFLLYETIAGSLFSIAVIVDAWFVAKKAPVDYQPDERNRPATYAWFVVLVLTGTGLVALLEAKRIQESSRSYRIAGKSMNPTLHEGEILFVDHEPYLEGEPQVGELVVYRSPINRSQHWTSRIIALGGQTVEIRKGELLIDGKSAFRGKTDSGLSTEELGAFRYEIAGMSEVADMAPVTVPKHHAFLICDNRNNSLDSRRFGAVSITSIDGRLKTRFWPRSKMGPLNVPAKNLGSTP